MNGAELAERLSPGTLAIALSDIGRSWGFLCWAKTNSMIFNMYPREVTNLSGIFARAQNRDDTSKI
jgi:hypothetical protein